MGNQARGKTRGGCRVSLEKKRVAVLMGGRSSEREVSLVSGVSVAAALIRAGFEARTIDVDTDLAAVVAALSDPRPDVVFNALHGPGGEDGTIQGALELLGIPYTHSGVMSSAIAMDKDMTKRVLSTVGVRSPKGFIVRKEDLNDRHPIEPPYVVKPVDEGSTVGVTLVRAGGNAPVSAAWTHGDRALVEEFVPGREFTVGVLDDRDGRAFALAVTEISYSSELYDYTAKYTAGHAIHVLPARIPEEVTAEAKRVAVLAHETLGCRGVTRSDFRWDDSKPGSDGLCFLEINNQPGMTPLSLVPEQAVSIGIDYENLVTRLVENAACRHRW